MMPRPKEESFQVTLITIFYADIQVTEDTPEPDQTSDSVVSPEAEPTSEAQEEVASDEAQDRKAHV